MNVYLLFFLASDLDEFQCWLREDLKEIPLFYSFAGFFFLFSIFFFMYVVVELNFCCPIAWRSFEWGVLHKKLCFRRNSEEILRITAIFYTAKRIHASKRCYFFFFGKDEKRTMTDRVDRIKYLWFSMLC